MIIDLNIEAAVFVFTAACILLMRRGLLPGLMVVNVNGQVVLAEDFAKW